MGLDHAVSLDCYNHSFCMQAQINGQEQRANMSDPKFIIIKMKYFNLPAWASAARRATESRKRQAFIILS